MMVKKSETGVAAGTKKAAPGAGGASTIKVIDGDRTPHDQLMKLPKAQIIRQMSIPDHTTRFIVDVDNQTKPGKRIIALMESLRDGNATTTKIVTEILGALANVVDKKPNPEK
ncbi:MAG: hypothetical protein QG577_1928 [Thermodesulfobacteriota bacterium]|nr:hypothetical protein [Thermodesulfobacteriota bacterium]